MSVMGNPICRVNKAANAFPKFPVGIIKFKGQTIVTSDYASVDIVLHIIKDMIYAMNHIESLTKDASKMLIDLVKSQIDSL